MDDLEGLEALDVIGECLDRILAALDACPEVDDPEAKAAAVKIRAAAIEAGEALMARRGSGRRRPGHPHSLWIWSSGSPASTT